MNKQLVAKELLKIAKNLIAEEGLRKDYWVAETSDSRRFVGFNVWVFLKEGENKVEANTVTKMNQAIEKLKNAMENQIGVSAIKVLPLRVSEFDDERMWGGIEGQVELTDKDKDRLQEINTIYAFKQAGFKEGMDVFD